MLSDADDMFFLRFDEIEPVVSGKTAGEMTGIAGTVPDCGASSAGDCPPSAIPDRVPGQNLDVRARVAERRAEYQRNLHLSPPAIIVGKYDPEKHKPDTVDASAELKGLAVSPGIVTGPARVILHAGTEQVLPGEILVAPFTDPGWTPYFIPAAGIVMDQGGLLSHGSIVAREYGIPAVVNVGPATKLIKTGQLIQVDGDSGVVRIVGAQA